MVLSGLGGMGKTQLAIEFATQNQFRFSAVLWLDGRSEDRLKQSVAKMADKIPRGQIPDLGRGHTTLDAANLDIVVKHVLDWLSILENNNWLIVFDNVDLDHNDPEPDSDAYDVKRYFPETLHGSVLITSRLNNLSGLGFMLRLERVDRSQAKVIFTNGYGRNFEGEFKS